MKSTTGQGSLGEDPAEEKPFGHLAHGDHPPDEQELRFLMGPAFLEFEETLRFLDGMENAWKYYGKKNGWIFKSGLKGKALLWLIPLPAGFKANFTLRPAEREAMLRMEGLSSFHESLAAAALLPEGYGVSVHVRSPDEGAELRVFALEVLKLRRAR